MNLCEHQHRTAFSTGHASLSSDFNHCRKFPECFLRIDFYYHHTYSALQTISFNLYCARTVIASTFYR